MGAFFSDKTGQTHVSNRFSVPIDNIGDSSFVQPITGETLQLYYWNSNVYTVDAGQAAGTVVMGTIKYNGILDSASAMCGNDADTSLAFTTGTIFTTIKPFRANLAEAPDLATLEEVAGAVTAGFANGEYCVDHRNGVVYGVKATTGDSDTIAYKVLVTSTGGGTVGSTVDLIKVGGVAVNVNGGAKDGGTQTVTLATDDAAVTLLGTIDADTNTIAGDTTSLDTKTPALGTAAMVASSPVTIASDDTLTVAANTLLGTIDADTDAIKTAVELIDDTVYTDGAGTPSKGILVMGNDGTNPQALSCNSDGELKVNLETADIEIGAVELKDGTTDARQAVKVDNATATATPTVALIGGIYKASLDTYDDNDAAPLHTDVNGKVLVVSSTTDALLTTIDVDTSKIPSQGTAAMVASTPVTIASDDTLTAAANALLGTIDTDTGVISGDTTSIDTKTPALGNAAMVAAVPVSIASDDTLTVAANASLAIIAGDTTSIDGKITACNTGAVVVASGAITETNSGTIAGDTTSIDGKITACNTGAVVVSSGAITETNSAAIAASLDAYAPQAFGTDATGADTYATVLTSVAAATHIDITNTGTFPAIISVDAGTTDGIYVAGNSTKTLDWLAIAGTTAVQAKNGAAGSNYTGLFISIW